MKTNLRISSSTITELKSNEIFVFGSNLAGRHGKGAAKTARKWGAEYGKCKGLQGRTYAIPTKDENLKTLNITKIDEYVKQFIMFAESRKDLIFLVTEIGCGLAGYSVEQIAQMFVKSLRLQNVALPSRFIEALEKRYKQNNLRSTT